MNIDKIEKMKTFPNYFKYIKNSLLENSIWIFLILFMFYMFSYLIVGVISIFIISGYDYHMDKKIFKAFRKRENK